MRQPDLEETAELVKPPQSRRGKGWSVVYRDPGSRFGSDRAVYIKRQSGYNTRVWWRGFRLTPRLVCEHRAILFCQQIGVPVPEVVSFTEQPDMTELILKDVGPARELDDYLSDCDQAERQQVLEKTATLIGRLHARRWIHGALGKDHLLVRDDGEVILIDLEKAHWNPFRIQRDLDRFWRRTPCLDESDKRFFLQTYGMSST